MDERDQNRHTAGDSSAEVPESKRTWPFGWIAASVALTGLLIGWLTGLSESPVAGIVLPLILALIAGAGGFHFAAKRPQSGAAWDLVRLTAQATSLFMVSCWVGLHAGVLVRSAPRTTPQTALTVSPADVQSLKPIETLRLAAFERRLQLLGVAEPTISAFTRRYVQLSLAKGRPGAKSPPTLDDLARLETAIKTVSRELEGAGADKRSSTLRDFRENIPMFLARIEQLREYLQRTQLAIPAEHYSEFLNLIDANNAALIEHREGNKKNTILTPAPAINYIPLYVLDLVIEVQKEPLADTYGRRTLDNESHDMEAIDEAIRLALNVPKREPIVVPKYSVKR